MRKTFLVSYVGRSEKLFTTESICSKRITIYEEDYKDAEDFMHYIYNELGWSRENMITIIALSEIPLTEKHDDAKPVLPF